MSETTIEPTEVEDTPFRDRANLTAELQEIARAKAPDHAAASGGLWSKIRSKR